MCNHSNYFFLVPKWGGMEWERVERRGERERGEEKEKTTVLNESLPLPFQGLADSKQLHDQ